MSRTNECKPALVRHSLGVGYLTERRADGTVSVKLPWGSVSGLAHSATLLTSQYKRNRSSSPPMSPASRENMSDDDEDDFDEQKLRDTDEAGHQRASTRRKLDSTSSSTTSSRSLSPAHTSTPSSFSVPYGSFSLPLSIASSNANSPARNHQNSRVFFPSNSTSSAPAQF